MRRLAEITMLPLEELAVVEIKAANWDIKWGDMRDFVTKAFGEDTHGPTYEIKPNGCLVRYPSGKAAVA